jgi:magnesium-transporting ATPase (P-type)
MLLPVEKLAEIMESKDKGKIDELGGVAKLAEGLGSDIQKGLPTASDLDIEQRKLKYGANKMERKPPPSIFVLFLDAMKDTTIIILLIAATISIIIGAVVCSIKLGKTCPRKPLWDVGYIPAPVDHHKGACLEWAEGVAVFLACLLVGTITALNNYKKELQFRALQSKQDDYLATVWRGGSPTQVSCNDIVVGDIVQLDTGAKVPADGIVIECTDLKVDESSLTGESVPVSKNTEAKIFMLSGCAVVEGVARYLVIAVGKHSEWGKIMTELDTERPDTPLQVKLTKVAETIGKFGLAVSLACFVSQVIIWLAEMGHKSCFELDAYGKITAKEKCNGVEATCNATGWRTHYENFHPIQINNLVKFFIDSVTIIVVAVPEGLPLAVTISLAYSVKRMQADMNLVRVMAACETMGGATTVCSDKTGTLTQNLMTVSEGFFAGRFWPAPPTRADLEVGYFEVLAQGISVNSRAELGGELPGGRPEVIGNKTEGAMLAFIRAVGADYRAERTRANVARTFPFSSLKKRMSTLLRRSGNDGRLHCKGASEVIAEGCDSYLASDGSRQPLTDSVREEVAGHIATMAGRGLRTLGLAVADVDDVGGVAGLEDAPAPDMRMTLVAVIGIRDPPREEVPEAVRKCQQAGILVRMITGDNVLTAKSIAREIGILTDGASIEGPDFRKMTPEEQRELLKTLQVMARCSPQDKLTLVRRLKEMGEVVAVTGDGTNDAPALKEADVGLSMGITGTAVAQEASDIVIMDDNFSSIVKSVLWGRSVYDNIRRFLQFQLTVNVTALTTCLAGAVTGFGTPLKPVQLLWVNLIMDTFGALALATELPTPDMLLRKPYGRNDRLVSGRMWRSILVQSMWQLFFCLGILFGTGPAFKLWDCVPEGKFAGGSGADCMQLRNDGVGNDTNGNYRDAIIYNAFVWAQLFNEINARKLQDELNPFEGIMKNRLFIGIFIGSAAMQFVTVQVAGIVFKAVPLDGDDWAICIILGMLSVPIGCLSRLLPPFDFINGAMSSSKVLPFKSEPEGNTAGASAP